MKSSKKNILKEKEKGKMNNVHIASLVLAVLLVLTIICIFVIFVSRKKSPFLDISKIKNIQI